MFQTVIGVKGSYPSKLHVSKDLRTTDNDLGKRSIAGLSLLHDIDSSTRGFCAILSGDLVDVTGVYPSHMEGQWSHGTA